MAPETGFLRESLGNYEVFSLKNPVSLVGCVSPDPNLLVGCVRRTLLIVPVA
ncbi:hypothetical protein [Phormidium nigroviride]